ncbi:MAG: SPOR domain-containing protein [Erythrobacter sp.]|nr:SPOR domain-containing protein [Erythrobacter sp.]
MDAKTMNRKSGPKFGTKLALLASAAVMTVTFTATEVSAAPRAEVSFNKAQKALKKGKTAKAISYAEAAVKGEPRNAQYRALLGKAYLDAGRYNSAATSFGDALELGDTNPRTVLSYALTQTAIGGGKDTLDTLMKYERTLDPADLGLALALAGNPERGVFVLTNALRGGQNTAKVRQNLAYTYSLAGNWRAARVMAGEDVPADQLDARLSQWASNAKPEDHMIRVSSLLGISPVGDRGMPAALALGNFPGQKEMMAKAEAQKEVAKAPVRVAKAPTAPKSAAPVPKPVSQSVAKPVGKTVETIAAATRPAPVSPVLAKRSPSKEEWGSSKTLRTPRRSSKTVAAAAPVFVSRPVTQELPAAPTATRVAAAPRKVPATAPKPVVAKAPKGDSHMVQLGSYSSEAEAKAGWASLQRKFGELAAHDVMITKAEVKGKTYYRVAAAGFGRQGAVQMCSTVRSAGRGCFAYVKSSPPAGAVGKGVRIAAASR